MSWRRRRSRHDAMTRSLRSRTTRTRSRYFRRHRDDDSTQVAPRTAVPYERAAGDRRSNARCGHRRREGAPRISSPSGGKWGGHARHDGRRSTRSALTAPPNRTRTTGCFGLLDTKAQGHGPLLVIIDGASKSFRTELPQKIYDRVSALRERIPSSCLEALTRLIGQAGPRPLPEAAR